MDYYSNLWNDLNPEVVPIASASHRFESSPFCKTIQQSDWDSLCSPFLSHELSIVINNLGMGKSPGLDGFTNEFYKQYWSIIEPDFLLFLSNFHQNSTIPSTWGRIHLFFIPKIQAPSRIKDF